MTAIPQRDLAPGGPEIDPETVGQGVFRVRIDRRSLAYYQPDLHDCVGVPNAICFGKRSAKVKE
jgi:hypothetical protein